MSAYITARQIMLMLKKWNLFNALIQNLYSNKLRIPTSEINPEISIRRSLLITRCVLFSLTSVFYLAGPPFSPIRVKTIVVFSVLIATILAQNLYDNWDLKRLYKTMMQEPVENTKSIDAANESTFLLLSLIVVETLGSALLILPTGGLDSPFVWYALNPIIAAVVYLPGLCCWGTLGLFLCTAIGVSKLYPGFTGSLISFIYDHMSILLVFFLSTSLAQIAVSLYKRLGAAYTSLAISHQATERYLKHISSLYQALEAFSTREDSAQLADVLAVYAGKLCEEPAACFLQERNEEGRDGCQTILRIVNQDGLDNDLDWEKEMIWIWHRIAPTDGIIVHPLNKEKGQLIAVPVISHGEGFGLLAYLQPPGAQKSQHERKQALMFLAGVAGIILERLKNDKLWARLLVSEEQNRIANEIHDGVAQYLFSMVCALDTISREECSLQNKKVQEQLQLLKATAARAARELRASIYKLSPYKRGESIFVDNLASYLDDLGRLNSIQVDLQTEGSEEVLSPALRKGLYRIIKEACSNAVRHGKCSSLKVRLSMSPNRTILEIKDNGCGYQELNSNAAGNCKTGLGNWNMYQLVTRFNGDLEIHSEPGRGTQVRCTIPKRTDREARFKEAVSK